MWFCLIFWKVVIHSDVAAPAQVPDTCMTFVANNRSALAKNLNLRRFFTMHLINLYEYNLITPEQIDNCLKVLDAPVELSS